MKKSLTLLCLCGALAFAFAEEARQPVEPINQDAQHVAIQGYDPVAYFRASQAVKGAAEHQFSWKGATWQFASAENRDAFAGAPEKYAPQFGGYCAWAVSHNYTAPVDPTAWKIVDGKLYLNYNAAVQQKWSAKMGEYIRQGHQNWPSLHR